MLKLIIVISIILFNLFVLVFCAANAASTYDRSLYKHWTDHDRDCQDTRQEVLIQESIEQIMLDEAGCRVTGGRWYDPYTNEYFTDPKSLDIDHMIPLKEAYDSGADTWDVNKKERFANDLNNKDSLIAVSRSVNRSKGSKDPALWLPPNRRYHCAYVRKWVNVKRIWGLEFDEKEEREILSISKQCN